jgi:drug/metabolite transporter (DMT)-like permease
VSRRGWVFFGLMCVIWGIPYVMIKIAVGGVSVPVVVFSRSAVGALVLWPLAARGGQVLTTLRAHWRPLVVFAICEMIGPWWLLSDAERRIPSSLTGLLIAAVPVLGALLAVTGGDAERFGPVRWVGLLVGLGGVALLAAPHLTGGDAWSVSEVLLTAVGYAVAPRIAATRLREVPSVLLTAACLSITALVYAAPAVVTRPVVWPSTPVLVALGGLALICTATAFLVFFRLIAEVGPARAVVFTYINPFVSVLAGTVVLAEPVTVLTVVAFALVLAGSGLATGRSRPPGLDTAAVSRDTDYSAATSE